MKKNGLMRFLERKIAVQVGRLNTVVPIFK